ncbi:MAG: hypothetical protein HFJ09_11965 [Lachnospiraceae bacterium]|nr:hypothetical protein [Lachnospiraceae bacterium]
MSCFYGIEQSCDECRMCQDKREKANTETVKKRKDDLISRERATQEISEIMADALISGFSQNTVSFGELNHKIQECLKNQPVAYDVDKVVEQLLGNNENIRANPRQSTINLEEAIRIVKVGGINE